MDDLKDLKNEIEKEKAVLVYFFNNDCAPCISLRPKVEKLVSKSFPNMKLRYVDSKLNADIPLAFGIYSNPTLLIFFEGKEFRRFSKFVSIIELEEVIKRYYDLVF